MLNLLNIMQFKKYIPIQNYIGGYCMSKVHGNTIIDLYAAIANLKEVDYKNTLIISALIELLVQKEIIDRSDVLTKALDLDLEHELNIEQQKLHMQ